MITADTLTDDQIIAIRFKRGHEQIKGGTISDLCICALARSHRELRIHNRQRCADILNGKGW